MFISECLIVCVFEVCVGSVVLLLLSIGIISYGETACDDGS